MREVVKKEVIKLLDAGIIYPVPHSEWVSLFCYELNGLFGALLSALGYEVTLLEARVYGDGGVLGIPYDHLALRVRTVDRGDWLADVGFGAHSHGPLQFGERGDQEDPVDGG